MSEAILEKRQQDEIDNIITNTFNAEGNKIFHLSCVYEIVDDLLTVTWGDSDVLTFGRSECRVVGDVCNGFKFNPITNTALSCKCDNHTSVARHVRRFYGRLCQAYERIHLIYHPEKIGVARDALLLFMWNMKPLLGRDMCTKIGQMVWAKRFEINLK